MKKLIATCCLVFGFATASFAEVPAVTPELNSPNVRNVQNKSDKPDVIILVVDDKGVIIDIIVIKVQ